MLMHCSRLLRRGAVCALLLVVARLTSSSLVLDSIPPMQQYFRVVRGQSSALDDDVNSSAVPVFPSVSSEMSGSDPSAESADGRSAAASLSFARHFDVFNCSGFEFCFQFRFPLVPLYLQCLFPCLWSVWLTLWCFRVLLSFPPGALLPSFPLRHPWLVLLPC